MYVVLVTQKSPLSRKPVCSIFIYGRPKSGTPNELKNSSQPFLMNFPVGDFGALSVNTRTVHAHARPFAGAGHYTMNKTVLEGIANKNKCTRQRNYELYRSQGETPFFVFQNTQYPGECTKGRTRHRLFRSQKSEQKCPLSYTLATAIEHRNAVRCSFQPTCFFKTASQCCIVFVRRSSGYYCCWPTSTTTTTTNYLSYNNTHHHQQYANNFIPGITESSTLTISQISELSPLWYFAFTSSRKSLYFCPIMCATLATRKALTQPTACQFISRVRV